MDDRSFDRGLRHSSVHMISSLSKRFRTGSLLCLSVFQASYGQDDHEKEPLPLPWGKHQLKHREDWDTKRIVWDDPAVLSRGRGVCVIKSDDCLEHELFSGHFFDESESAYVDFDVGRSEAACLGRALTNWRLCGSLPWRDIEMTYIPSGASSSFPSTHEVREAKKVARGPLIGSGDGCSVRVFPNTSILNEDRKSSLVQLNLLVHSQWNCH